MNIRVAINGFGRIGRSVFRILCDHPSIEVVCINDIFKNEALAYLLKYDTIMGTLKQDVTHDDHALYVGGKKILMTSVRNPAEAKWKELGIDVVIESTGIFTARADLEKHLAAGAKRVLLTVPPKDNVDQMVVMGVNDDQLKPEHRLVSNASCTTNCLAPLAKVLDDAFGIKHGIMTTVHAYTNDQRLADVPHEDFRRSRAAAENIIPTTTGAARAVGIVLPQAHGQARRHRGARAGLRRLGRRSRGGARKASRQRSHQRGGKHGAARARSERTWSTPRCRWSRATSLATRTRQSSIRW